MKNIIKRIMVITMAILMCTSWNISALAMTTEFDTSDNLTGKNNSVMAANPVHVTEKEVESFVTALPQSVLDNYEDVDFEAFLSSLSVEDFETFQKAINDGIMPLLLEGETTVTGALGDTISGTFSAPNGGKTNGKTYFSFDISSTSSDDVAIMSLSTNNFASAKYNVYNGHSTPNPSVSFNNGWTLKEITVHYDAFFHGGGNRQRNMVLKCWTWSL